MAMMIGGFILLVNKTPPLPSFLNWSCMGFPQAADLQELSQYGSCSMGSILQEWTTPTWVPHIQQIPSDHLLLHGLLSMGYTAPAQGLLLWGLSIGHSFLQVNLLFLGLQCGDVLHRGTTLGLQGDNLLHKPQETSVLATGAPPSISSSLTLVYAGLFLFPLSPRCCCASFFFPLS